MEMTPPPFLMLPPGNHLPRFASVLWNFLVMVTHVSWKPIALVTPLQAAIAVTQLGFFIHQLTSHLPIHQVLQFFTLVREA